MGMKKAIISLSIVAILTICVFNGVAAAAVSKQTTDVRSNYAVDARGNQQTYLAAYLGLDDATALTMGVGQYTYLYGVLSVGTPPTSSNDYSHGIGNARVNIQSMNSDGKTWSTVATHITSADASVPGMPLVGFFSAKLTPNGAGVYTYRVTYDGESQYAPTVSNVVTLTVTNVVIS